MMAGGWLAAALSLVERRWSSDGELRIDSSFSHR
jgi:hypothetical protein